MALLRLMVERAVQEDVPVPCLPRKRITTPISQRAQQAHAHYWQTRRTPRCADTFATYRAAGQVPEPEGCAKARRRSPRCSSGLTPDNPRARSRDCAKVPRAWRCLFRDAGSASDVGIAFRPMPRARGSPRRRPRLANRSCRAGSTTGHLRRKSGGMPIPRRFPQMKAPARTPRRTRTRRATSHESSPNDHCCSSTSCTGTIPRGP